MTDHPMLFNELDPYIIKRLKEDNEALEFVCSDFERINDEQGFVIRELTAECDFYREKYGNEYIKQFKPKAG